MITPQPTVDRSVVTWLQWSLPTPLTEHDLTRLAAMAPSTPPRSCPSEKEVQNAIVSLACGSRVSPGLGFDKYSTSQYRASHISEGIADLKLYNDREGVAVWWETKTYQAKPWKTGDMVLKPLSHAQEGFRAHCRACNELFGWGALPEFYALLVLLGFAAVTVFGAVVLTPHRNSA
jgi:hypothetical protein